MVFSGKFLTTVATAWLTSSIVFSLGIPSVQADMALKRLSSYSWKDTNPVRNGSLDKSHNFANADNGSDSHADIEDDYSR